MATSASNFAAKPVHLWILAQLWAHRTHKDAHKGLHEDRIRERWKKATGVVDPEDPDVTRTNPIEQQLGEMIEGEFVETCTGEGEPDTLGRNLLLTRKGESLYLGNQAEAQAVLKSPPKYLGEPGAPSPEAVKEAIDDFRGKPAVAR